MRWKPYNAYENALIDKKLSYARRIVTIIVVIMIIIAAVVQKQKKLEWYKLGLHFLPLIFVT